MNQIWSNIQVDHSNPMKKDNLYPVDVFMRKGFFVFVVQLHLSCNFIYICRATSFIFVVLWLFVISLGTVYPGYHLGRLKDAISLHKQCYYISLEMKKVMFGTTVGTTHPIIISQALAICQPLLSWMNSVCKITKMFNFFFAFEWHACIFSQY